MTSDLGPSWPGADERHSEGIILILNHIRLPTWPSLAVGRRQRKSIAGVSGRR